MHLCSCRRKKDAEQVAAERVDKAAERQRRAEEKAAAKAAEKAAKEADKAERARQRCCLTDRDAQKIQITLTGVT